MVSMVTVIMVMAATGTLFAMIMVVMVFLLLMMVMLMLIAIIVMMATAAIVIIVTMVMMMLMLIVKILHFLHQFCFQILGTLNSLQDPLAIQLVPGSGNNGCLRIMLTNRFYTLFQLLFADVCSTA